MGKKPTAWPIRVTFLPQPTHAGDVPTPTKRWAGVPTHIRLRKLLKVMLRGFGMKVTEVRTWHPDFAPEAEISGDPKLTAKPKRRKKTAV